MGTLHRFNWCQLASGLNHHESGTVQDASESVSKELGIPDAYLKLYPYNGYGDTEIIRKLLVIEKPDVILHFTDPRYFSWLYSIRDQFSDVMLCYLNIWDDLPYPRYNRDFYRSSDAIMAISKQTFNINKAVIGKNNVDILDFTKETK